jgi:thiol-disulfide isomerase/thioredoxin
MRMLFTLVLAVGLVAPTVGQDKDPPKKPEAKLKVGDPAPSLKATKWLQGTEVKSFEKGKIYIVEFWATWCGPCIVMMPHMSEMQQEYKDKGVTFIGYTAKDPNNSAEKVAKFVDQRGPKLKYTFAFADDRDSYDAWMKAAGQGGIPCCFVVDKDTRIAYIGHPMYLDEVLPHVVAGTWSPDAAAALAKVEKEVEGVFRALGGDPEAALKAVAEFEKAHPKLAGIPYFNGPKISAMLKAKKTSDAKTFAEHLIAKAVKNDDSGMLQSVSATLRSPAAGGDKELAALSLRAAEGMLKINGEKDPVALYFVAEAHFAGGDKARAKEFGARAVAAAADERMKMQLENLTKKYAD